MTLVLSQRCVTKWNRMRTIVADVEYKPSHLRPPRAAGTQVSDVAAADAK